MSTNVAINILSQIYKRWVYLLTLVLCIEGREGKLSIKLNLAKQCNAMPLW